MPNTRRPRPLPVFPALLLVLQLLQALTLIPTLLMSLLGSAAGKKAKAAIRNMEHRVDTNPAVRTATRAIEMAACGATTAQAKTSQAVNMAAGKVLP